jgi:hypothetical protein
LLLNNNGGIKEQLRALLEDLGSASFNPIAMNLRRICFSLSMNIF